MNDEPAVSEKPADPPQQKPWRISSLDMDDLPAVFGFDPSLDEAAPEPAPPPPPPPASVRPSAQSQRPQSLGGAASISPSLGRPVSSLPAISPPFTSIDAVELAEELAAASVPPETVAAIEARLAAGDYGRALVLAESALVAHPGSQSVTRFAETCRDELYKRYLERLGAADHIPRIAVQHGALTGLALDHRVGFLLSCVDGGSTVEEIIDVSAMPRLEAVRVLYELLQDGIIEMTSRR